jgi:hypothetical protein
VIARSTLFAVIYVGVGVWAATTHDYLEDLDRLTRIVSALLAVLLWPLVLLGVDLRIK